MGTEVYTASESTIEVISPIDGSTLLSVPYVRDFRVSDRPAMQERAYANSSAVVGYRNRPRGGVSLKKDAETLRVADTLRAWQEGVIVFPMTSTLKGTRYRHPHLRITYTNADGTTDRITAYDCKVSERSHERGTPSTDTLSIDALGGIDEPSGDRGEPKRALDFHRTGSASYINTEGTLTTATDGQARIGLPYVMRRNMVVNSSFKGTTSGWTMTAAGTEPTIAYNSAANPITGAYDAFTLTDDSSANQERPAQDITVTSASGTTYAVSAYVKNDATAGHFPALRVAYGTNHVHVQINPSTGALNKVATSGSGAYFTVGATATAVGNYWRIVVTFTTDGTSTSGQIGLIPTTGTTWGTVSGSGTGSATFYGPQFEQASTATAYQATNSSGVDLTNPINGAGLVLEGAGSNLVLRSQEFDNALWDKSAGGGWNAVTVSANSTTAPDGTATADTVTSPSVGSHAIRQSVTVVGNTIYTFSIWVKNISHTELRLMLWDLTAGGVVSDLRDIRSEVSTSEWRRVSATFTTASGTTSIAVGVGYNGTMASKSFYLWGAQLEQCPFATSYIATTSTTATRNADLCGIVSPHNELKYSHDLTQGSVWTANGMSQPSKSGDDNTVTFGATWHSLIQVPTLSAVPGTTRTVAIRVKLPSSSALSGAFNLRFLDQSGAAISGTTRTIQTTELSTSEYRTFYTSVTPSTSVTGLQVAIVGSSGTGSILVRSLGLVQGSHPGIEVRTTDTAIAKPADGGLDPAWVQNGAIEFDMISPTVFSSGSYPVAHVQFFGAENSGTPRAILRFFRSSGYSATTPDYVFDRAHNGSTGGGGVVGRSNIVGGTVNLFDGAKHRIRLEWYNYTIGGVRHMLQYLYVDGTLRASADAAASYGASSWLTPNHTIMVSDGTVNNVLSNLTIAYPVLPAGAQAAA